MASLKKTQTSNVAKYAARCFGQFWLNSRRASVKFHCPLLGQTVSPVSFLSQSKRLLLNRDLIFRFLDFLSKLIGYKLNMPCHHASFHELLSWNDSQQEVMKTGSCAVDINVHERVTITNHSIISGPFHQPFIIQINFKVNKTFLTKCFELE